jgi:hypothetical protein
MSKLAKTLQAAAGNAGGDKLYVDDVFSTYLYTGTGSAITITNGIDLAGEGGMVWNKCRTSATNHAMSDTERGIPSTLKPNKTQGESTSTGYFTSFNSDGWSMGGNTETNLANEQFASWTWRKSPKYFDIVTYTGNGVARTIAHSLGSVPGMIIVKSTTYGLGWPVYHRSLGQYTNTLYLDATSSAGASKWNEQLPTDSAFPISANDYVNKAGETYVAYLWAHDAGGFGDDGEQNVISCGSFTCDAVGSATVSLGYEPQFVIMKKADGGAQDWITLDVLRGWSQTSDNYLRPNSSAAEVASSGLGFPTATGFTEAGLGSSGSTYIYMAIRRPMKTPASGTEVFAPVSRTGNASVTTVSAGFAPDFVLSNNTSNGASNRRIVGTKLIGTTNYLRTETTASELVGRADAVTSYTNSGIVLGADVDTAAFNTNNFPYILYMMRRAPSFMDVVCYTGTGSGANTVTHGLTVAPELLITKIRSGGTESGVGGWGVYAAPLTIAKVLELNATTASASDNWFSGNTGDEAAPTSTQFTVWGNDPHSNRANGNYAAYLFASLAGVSKIASYSGTGNFVNVDCGFAAGARFVMIKRTDSTGDWYVWDSARGIVAGNDPYLLLNSAVAQVTNTDYIDPLASGFTVTSSAPAALNASGGTYIFLAIA